MSVERGKYLKRELLYNVPIAIGGVALVGFGIGLETVSFFAGSTNGEFLGALMMGGGGVVAYEGLTHGREAAVELATIHAARASKDLEQSA